MEKDFRGENRLSMILVSGTNRRAIVPAGGDHLLPVAEGSVTVEAMRRAARVGERKRGTSAAAILEATIDRDRGQLELQSVK